MTGPAEPRSYRAAAGVIRVEPLDTVLTAVFHRSSGITHLLTEPAPQILAALGHDWRAPGQLLARLDDTFDLSRVDAAALAARLAELVASGLVEEWAA